MDWKWAQIFHVSPCLGAVRISRNLLLVVHVKDSSNYDNTQKPLDVIAEAAARGIVLRAWHIELEADFHLGILHVGSIQSPLDIVSCIGLILEDIRQEMLPPTSPNLKRPTPAIKGSFPIFEANYNVGPSQPSQW